jgi:hypothetical protein
MSFKAIFPKDNKKYLSINVDFTSLKKRFKNGYIDFELNFSSSETNCLLDNIFSKLPKNSTLP